MRKATFVPLIVILVVFSLTGLNGRCMADEVFLGQQAENAGDLQQALAHYVEALKADETNQQLREKIIKLARKMQPPPEIPEKVVVYEGRAEAAFQYAKIPSDYLDAVKEYKKALQIAPWASCYYFNIGMAFEKAGKIDEAVRSLKLYLIAEPNASDEREVRKKIAGLEYAKEKQTRIALARPKEIAREGRFIAYDNGTVVDTKTGLMWAAKDNDEDISWGDAKVYCENYRGGGYTDWRLPTIDEVRGLYDTSKSYEPKLTATNVHLPKLIEITTCCLWISEKGGSRVNGFRFTDGTRKWPPKSYSRIYRALPVRIVD